MTKIASRLINDINKTRYILPMGNTINLGMTVDITLHVF